MLLTISTTHHPATDLGYLLHKNPERVQTFPASFGEIHVFYPEATVRRCTAALLLDVDPIGLVRGQGRSGGSGPLGQYVNDRPYVASSFMSVAIAEVFGTAMGGRSKERPDLAETAIPVEMELAVLPCRGGHQFLKSLFEPLGYEMQSERLRLDEQFPEWGESRYFHVKLKGIKRISEVLSHLYVLIPVLDDDKHYWVGTDEVDKLLSKGAGWLSSHPEKQIITERYLSHQKSLSRAALDRLLAEEPTIDDEQVAHDQEEEIVEERIRLGEQRLGTALSALKAAGAKKVLDLGCGEGRLLKMLMQDSYFHLAVGLDVSHRALEVASRRLNLERLSQFQQDRVRLMHGSLTYRDKRFEGFDAVTVIEVIEHLDVHRLAAFEKVLFESARPRCVIVTTPNVEYNALFTTLPAGTMRHKDHRFEWTRREFESWAASVADRCDYSVRFLGVGPEHAEFGSPTQMAVFEQ